MNNQELAVLLGASLGLPGEELPKLFDEDPVTRFGLALKLAGEEYAHPESAAVASLETQRSFCFHHDRMTEKAVLLLHGFTACPYEMRELGHILFEKGYNVFGARLAGHGTVIDDFVKTNHLDWQNSAQKGLAITALLGKEVAVIGESMGGCLATLLASNFPDLIKEIILCAPCFRIANPMAAFTAWGWLRHFMPQTELGVRQEWQMPYWYGAIPTAAVAQLVKLSRLARQTATNLKVPVLIIQARNDQAVKYQGAEAFFEKLRNLPKNKKKLRLFDGGHHNLTIDLNPAKLKVFQWITDCLGKEG